MKKTSVIKFIFWSYIVAYALWFLNHHFLKLGITQGVLNWIPELFVLRVRDTLAHYSNELFFINFFAFMAYLAKEIFWDVPLPIDRAYNWDFITISKVAHLVSRSFSLSEDDVLHGLLIATYEGAFKEGLFSEVPKPTKHEKEMTEDFFSNPQWKGFSSKQIGSVFIATTTDGELRPLASGVVTDELLLEYLRSYELVFEGLFPKLSRGIKTFADLKKDYSTEFQHFLRIDPTNYRLSNNFANPAKEFTINLPLDSIFLQEFKKMKISGKNFKAWLKRFLNGDFDR